MPTRPPPPPSLLSAASAVPPYKDVRSLARGLDVLKALNRAPGGQASTTDLAKAIADAFLGTPFEGGRHQRRVDLIDTLPHNPSTL